MGMQRSSASSAARPLVSGLGGLAVAWLAAGAPSLADTDADGPHFGETTYFADEAGSVAFKMLPPPPAGVTTELINGQLVPASVTTIVRITTGANLLCTASLVGSRVILTAAHCLRDGAAMTNTISFKIGPKTATGRCGWLQSYPATPTKDWALCLLNRDVQGMSFERVDLTHSLPAGTPIVVTGYGCTEAGVSDGKLRYGFHDVARVPPATPWDNSGMVGTLAKPGAPQLCHGDSGGPVFRFTDVALDAGSWSDCRRQVATNLAEVSTGSLYLPLTFAKALFNGWTQATGQVICGYNSDGQDAQCVSVR